MLDCPILDLDMVVLLSGNGEHVILSYQNYPNLQNIATFGIPIASKEKGMVDFYVVFLLKIAGYPVYQSTK